MTWIVIEIGNKMKLKMRIINSRTRTWCSRWLAFSKAHVALCHHQSIDSIIFVLIGRMLHIHTSHHTPAPTCFHFCLFLMRPLWCLIIWRFRTETIFQCWLLLLLLFSFPFNQYFNLKFDYATTTMVSCCPIHESWIFFRSFQNERKTLYKKKQMV